MTSTKKIPGQSLDHSASSVLIQKPRPRTHPLVDRDVYFPSRAQCSRRSPALPPLRIAWSPPGSHRVSNEPRSACEMIQRKATILWGNIYGIRPEYRLTAYAVIICFFLIFTVVLCLKLVKWDKDDGQSPQGVSHEPGDLIQLATPKTVTAPTRPPNGDTDTIICTGRGWTKPEPETLKPVLVRDLFDLNSLDRTTRSILISDLRGWPTPTPSQSVNSMANGLDLRPSPIIINSARCPELRRISVRGKISEQKLSELLVPFASTLEDLELDMRELCLGSRLDESGLAGLRLIPLPNLRSLTLRNSNGCPLTTWVLSWEVPSCTEINFCSSYIDDGTLEMLKAKANSAPSSLSVGRYETGLCSGCELVDDASPHVIRIREHDAKLCCSLF